MSLVLDAGALIGIDRGDRDLVALIKRERVAGRVAVTHGGVIGQVWRDGARQARLARFLKGVDIRPLDEELGRRCGALLAASGTSDVIDAAVIAVADHDDVVLTSDPSDLRALATAARLHVDIAAV